MLAGNGTGTVSFFPARPMRLLARKAGWILWTGGLDKAGINSGLCHGNGCSACLPKNVAVKIVLNTDAVDASESSPGMLMLK